MISTGQTKNPIIAPNNSCLETVSLQPVLRHEMLCAIPPLVFLEKICCLALIMGESRDSGQGLGFDHSAS